MGNFTSRMLVEGIGIAGTPAGGVVSVQGVAGGVGSTVNLTQVGGVNITLGQKTMAASVPVVLASDQSDVPVNIDKYGGTATTLGQKTMAASVPVTMASDQTGGTSMNLTQVGGVNITLGQKLMASSIPVVISSDQSAIPVNATIIGTPGVNISQYGGVATTLGQKTQAASIPVVVASDQTQQQVNNAIVGAYVPTPTPAFSGDYSTMYRVIAGRPFFLSHVFAGAGNFQYATLHHLVGAAKRVLIYRVAVWLRLTTAATR